MILNLDKALVNNSVMLNGISNKKSIKHAMNNAINLNSNIFTLASTDHTSVVW